MSNEHRYLLLPAKEPLYLPAPDLTLPEWIIDLLDEAHDHAFEVLVDQMQNNPDAIEALYG